ncbi:hypothetical protein B7755_011565 [Streptomyces sp. NBS 14/10]|uniref:hypothetical protein n=1 Tax=Streptomyces sp. NBS 14/10 TaxID=1945643 RepID=UPI00117DDE74|nr:hypothetical protein [Streptomyces sp. NBS 14/10]KAK1178718.1 hypothetical protein B7755_011565 [Streptomyces sp. NBS 14/10]
MTASRPVDGAPAAGWPAATVAPGPVAGRPGLLPGARPGPGAPGSPPGHPAAARVGDGLPRPRR